MMNCPRLVYLFFLILFFQNVNSDERILSFHSDISVDSYGAIEVTEIITVRAEQSKIRRGIYRDFPTAYQDRLGNRYRVGFEAVSVQRDGVVENFFTRNLGNGVRTFFGNENYVLPPGEYTYTFTYMTSRQLGFYENFDELYWNVTGNAWEFPIDKASANIFLPESIPDARINTTAYTGLQGSNERAFSENRFSGGNAYFETNRQLNPNEGLTVVISWPKGHIIEPTFDEKLNYFFQDNRAFIVGLGGLLILFFYYVFTWRMVGKDPKSNVIITHYQPPKGFSPASLRYVEEMGYDNKCFASAVLNLAVKGYLKISETDGEYTLIKTGKKVVMAPGELSLVNKLFQGSMSRVLKNKNHKFINNALEAHENALSRNYETQYFITNSGYFMTGIVLSILIVISVIFSIPDLEQSAGNIFIMAWLTGWSFGVFFLIKGALATWVRAKSIFTIIAAVYASLFALMFTGIEIYVFTQFSHEINKGILLIAVAVAGINWLFYEFLKAPTLAGRRLMDKIEGFRRYVEVAEKQQLARKHPKGRTPELFEMYLPYALAMDVEQKWAEKFSDVLVKITSDKSTGYHPVWYSGAGWNDHNIGGFSSSLASGFSNAISSSATAPGSGSGGGGGGFSGGGGGGW
jgi:uncharacterized membrane protein YgcG